jgi:predicted chitinase
VKKGKANSESGPWKKFIAPFKPGGQESAEYVLFGGDEVQQMIANQYAGKTVILRFGSEGPLVKSLQQALAAKTGKAIEADGKFGKSTFDALIAFQRKTFGPSADDGIVGPDTAEKLGLELPLFDFKAAIAGHQKPAVVAPEQGEGTQSHGTGAATSENSESPLTLALLQAISPAPAADGKRAIYDKYAHYFMSKACADTLRRFGIDAKTIRLAHFMAQAAHETGGFTLFRESLNYTSVEAVRKAFQKRAKKLSDAFIRDNLLNNPVAFGIWAYGDRFDNRPDSDDGFRFRGGGIFQTTGRSQYREKGERANVDLEGNPDLIEDPAISMIAACAEWEHLKCNALADNDDVKRISRGINRGNVNAGTPANGEADRINFLKRAKAAFQL